MSSHQRNIRDLYVVLVGPTNKTCSMSSDVSNPAARELYYDELYKAYCEQIDAMIEGGIDAISDRDYF